MSEFDSISSRQVQQSAIPAANAQAASWRQVFKRAVEQSPWISTSHGQRSNHSKETSRVFMQSLFSRKYLSIALLLVVLGSFIVLAFARYAMRPATVKEVQSRVASGKSLLGLPRSQKPKPAPGKPFVPETQSHLPIPAVWTPAPQSQQSPWTPAPQNPLQTPTVTQQAPPQVAVTPPPQPMIPARSGSSFTPLVYTARHDKHFGGSCSGQLTLSATGLAFHCSDDSGENVQVALNEIGAVDENGVQLTSGKKYHFSIPGMSKSGEQQLFTTWLHQVR